MHYKEQVLIHELANKYDIEKEMVFKLLKESKKSSYSNQRNSKKIAEIENIIYFYMKSNQKDEEK